MSPLVHEAAKVRWQFFCSLSFKGTVPSPVAQRKIAFAWLYQGARLGRRHFHTFLWVLREEKGELTARDHYHALISGFPEFYVNPRTCLALMSLWEKVGGGNARVRVFEPSSNGVEYVFKDLSGLGGNPYELCKFGSASGVTLSKSLVKLLVDQQGQGKASDGVIKQIRIRTTAKAAQAVSIPVRSCPDDSGAYVG